MEHLGPRIGAGFVVPFTSFNNGKTLSIPNTRGPPDTDYPAQPNFHGFLKYNGWEITDEGVLALPNTIDQPLDVQAKQRLRTAFVQRWLFFELLWEVFRDLQPLDFNRFVIQKVYRPEITTKYLGEYLMAWMASLESPDWAGTKNARIFKAQIALNRARDIVRKHLAHTAPSGERWGVEENVVLGIIVLGEALTAALIRVRSGVLLSITHLYDNDYSALGWGYPECVLNVFDQRKGIWCPKMKQMLKDLMRDNTIGLLLAQSNQLTSTVIIDGKPIELWHGDCEVGECKALKQAVINQNLTSILKDTKTGSISRKKLDINSADAAQKVEPRHAPGGFHSRVDSSCEFVGIIHNSDLESQVVQIIMSEEIPLFTYDKVEEKISVHRKNERMTQYVVFSHVWADAWGNGKENTIRKCVASYLTKLCENVRSSEPQRFHDLDGTRQIYFWIDILGIPSSDAHIRARNKTLSKIHTIYSQATCSIVLDNGLLTQSYRESTSASIIITMCNWMQRLWTLQEAVLSDPLYFVFVDDMHSLSNIDMDLHTDDGHFHGCTAHVARTYYDGLMGNSESRMQVHRQLQQEQRGFRGPSALDRKTTSGPKLTARVWRALQWRTCGTKAHEALALAILLKVPERKLAEVFAPLIDLNTEFSPDALERKMEILLDDLGHRDPCCIPPGMIFLGGPKLKSTGFAWAPSTWMSTQQVYASDPLDIEDVKTELDHSGLVVHFPGILLRKLSTNGTLFPDPSQIHVPVYVDLHDWYLIEPASDGDSFPQEIRVNNRPLAIIAVKLENTVRQELGLIVALDEEPVVAPSGSQKFPRLNVKILGRVLVSKERRHQKMVQCQDDLLDSGLPSTLIGQVLPPDQEWCVDGEPDDITPTPIKRTETAWQKVTTVVSRVVRAATLPVR